MGSTKGSTDEAIGRPDEWREGRYEQAGNPVDTAVNERNQEEAMAPDDISTRVTQRDYEDLTPPERRSRADRA